MRILFLTENFPPEMNAAATRVYERAAYWVKWGHKVTVVTCAPNFPLGKVFDGYKNKWKTIEVMDGIRVVRVKTYMAPNSGTFPRMMDFLSFMITGTIAGLFQEKPDVVAATSPQFFSAIAGWLVGGLRRVPFVFELGDLWPASITAVGAMEDNFFLRLMEKLELFLYRRSACVAALTQSFKDDLISRNIPADKIAVVINGVDLPRYSPRKPDPALAKEWEVEGCFIVGYIGTHGMAHALEKVLDAAAILRNDPKIRFLFVGPGAVREALIAEAKGRKLDNVIFAPPQPKERMPDFWGLCNVALVHLKDTPVFESVIPSKIFEAMGMGLPVLLSAPAGEASRIVVQEGIGIHLPPESPMELAQAITRLKNNQTEYLKFAQASYAAAPHHSRERQAREMLAVLQAAVDGRGSEAAKAVVT
ncbi:MAG: glycosyltransferase family 4 protein [Planctomycetes bacterium]|nr:glycosyltransferase family 4 protein [Planctomycetota bacterium]